MAERDDGDLELLPTDADTGRDGALDERQAVPPEGFASPRDVNHEHEVDGCARPP